MKLLLDTHILLWWLEDSPKLPEKTKTAIADGKNQILVSAATVWEMEIKRRLGKLKSPGNIQQVIATNRFEEMPIQVSHAIDAARLKAVHSDPFDRMLIAQANVEKATLATTDKTIRQYSVKTL